MTVNERALYIYSKVREAGLTHAGALGLIGNFQGETSQLDPIAVERSYLNKFGLTNEEYVRRAENDEVIYNGKKFKYDSAGFGLAQWTYWSRKQGLLDFAKARNTSIADIDTQLAYAFKEMKERYTQTWKILTTTNSIYNAVKICVTEFEKPEKQYEAIQTRNSYANNWAKIIPEDYKWTEDPEDKVEPPNNEEPPVAIIPVESALTDRKRVIKKALGEVGYIEKRTNDQLDDPTANAGANDYTKYARDLDAIPGFYNGKKNGYAWCDMFVDWCFVQCFGVEKAVDYLCQKMGGAGAGCTYSMQYFQAKGQFVRKSEGKPQPGDQIFFGDSLNNSYHTGLVYAVDATKVYTVEGNTTNSSSLYATSTMTLKKEYPLSYASILGYGRPAWNDGYTGNGFEIEGEQEETFEAPSGSEVNEVEVPPVNILKQFDRLKLIKVALTEVGYKEKRSNSNLDDREANAGNKDFNKYARDLDAIPEYYYHDSKQGLSWCDIFVDWCMMKAYGFEDSVKLNGQGKLSYGAGCPQSAAYYRKIGRLDMKPQVGDQFWLGWDGSNEYHTGIVIGVGTNYVDVVEGNQAISSGVDGVVKKRRMWYEIVGFGHPDYNDGYGTDSYIGNMRTIAELEKEIEEERNAPPVEEENPPVVVPPAEEEKPPVEPETPNSHDGDLQNTLPMISKGSEGAPVRVLQMLLGGFGFPCGDGGKYGMFGDSTDAALREFQKARSLEVDGICGEQSWSELLN